jgi:hypothetical protein
LRSKNLRCSWNLGNSLLFHVSLLYMQHEQILLLRLHATILHIWVMMVRGASTWRFSPYWLLHRCLLYHLLIDSWVRSVTTCRSKKIKFNGNTAWSD